jgi:hypothetical protein
VSQFTVKLDLRRLRATRMWSLDSATPPITPPTQWLAVTRGVRNSVVLASCIVASLPAVVAQGQGKSQTVKFSVLQFDLPTDLVVVRKDNVCYIRHKLAKGLQAKLSDLGEVKEDKVRNPDRLIRDIFKGSATKEQLKTLQPISTGRFDGYAVVYKPGNDKMKVATAFFVARSHLMRCDFMRPIGKSVTKERASQLQVCIDSIR